jgi:hypothetical protein
MEDWRPDQTVPSGPGQYHSANVACRGQTTKYIHDGASASPRVSYLLESRGYLKIDPLLPKDRRLIIEIRSNSTPLPQANVKEDNIHDISPTSG